MAIAAVGSQYTDAVEFSRCVIPIREFLRWGLTIEFQGGNMPTLSIPILQALVLSQVGMLYHGSSRMSRLAKGRSSLLMQGSNIMSLLTTARPLEDTHCGGEIDIERCWKQWLNEETRQRLGYTIWARNS